MKKTKTREALYSDSLYQKNADGASLHQFSSEKMTPCEGIIREDTIMYLMLEGGILLKCRC